MAMAATRAMAGPRAMAAESSSPSSSSAPSLPEPEVSAELLSLVAVVVTVLVNEGSNEVLLAKMLEEISVGMALEISKEDVASTMTTTLLMLMLEEAASLEVGSGAADEEVTGAGISETRAPVTPNSTAHSSREAPSGQQKVSVSGSRAQ